MPIHTHKIKTRNSKLAFCITNDKIPTTTSAYKARSVSSCEDLLKQWAQFGTSTKVHALERKQRGDKLTMPCKSKRFLMCQPGPEKQIPFYKKGTKTKNQTQSAVCTYCLIQNPFLIICVCVSQLWFWFILWLRVCLVGLWYGKHIMGCASDQSPQPWTVQQLDET